MMQITLYNIFFLRVDSSNTDTENELKISCRLN
jgi:hypothetical protein